MANKAGSSGRAVIGAAVVAGLIAGAGVLYMRGAPADNAAADCTVDQARMASLKPLMTGDIAALGARDEPVSLAALTFNDGEGRPVTLASLGSKPLLVNLWATWCVPCREEMPALNALQAKAGGAGFGVVPISVDAGEPDKPKAFYEEIGLDALPFFHDGTLGVFNALKKQGLVFGLPATLITDEKGCVIAAMNGPADWAGADAMAFVEALKVAPAQ